MGQADQRDPRRGHKKKKRAKDNSKKDHVKEPKLRSFLFAAEGLGDGAADLVGRVEAWRESVSGSADLDGALDVAAKKLSSGRKQINAAHLALLAAITAAEDQPPTEQTSLMPEGEAQK